MEDTELLANGQIRHICPKASIMSTYVTALAPGDWSNYQMLVPGNGTRTISTHINPDRGKLYVNFNVDTMMVATTQEWAWQPKVVLTHFVDNTGGDLGLYYIQVVPWSISTANERLDFDLEITWRLST